MEFRRYGLFIVTLISMIFATGCDTNQPVNESNVMLVEKVIQVEMQAPDTTWQVTIEKVASTPNAIVVIAALSQKNNGGMTFGAQVISTVSDSVTLELGNKEAQKAQQIYVTGKTFGWQDKTHSAYTFVNTPKAIEQILAKTEHKILWQRP